MPLSLPPGAVGVNQERFPRLAPGVVADWWSAFVDFAPTGAADCSPRRQLGESGHESRLAPEGRQKFCRPFGANLSLVDLPHADAWGYILSPPTGAENQRLLHNRTPPINDHTRSRQVRKWENLRAAVDLQFC